MVKGNIHGLKTRQSVLAVLTPVAVDNFKMLRINTKNI